KIISSFVLQKSDFNMKLELWCVGPTAFDYLKTGIDIYEKRLKHFLPYETIVIPDVKQAKSLSEEQLKTKEGELILKKLDSSDFLMLLDEGGKQYSSMQFSEQLEGMLQQSYKRIIF